MLKFTSYDIVFQEIPDEVTLAINISGCPNRCVGCHTPELTEDIGEELTEDVLFELIDGYRTSITCVCFMGGDNSSKDIEMLARQVKLNGLKSGWYSGIQNFSNDLSVDSFDFIKLGPYIASLGGLDSPRTNQRLYRIEKSEFVDITFMLSSKKMEQ